MAEIEAAKTPTQRNAQGIHPAFVGAAAPAGVELIGLSLRAMSAPEVAVGAVVIKDGALLMVRRGTEPAKGRWTIPGGRIEHGETIEAAVLREVREETGLLVEIGWLLGIHEVIDEHHFVILDYEAEAPDGQDPVAGDDAAEVRWVPLAEVESLDTTDHLVDLLREWGIPV
jgi:8-oxo-dGTP diphosphatase